MQANLQRKNLATNEMYIEAAKRRVALAMVQEPYVGGVGKMRSCGPARVYQCVGQEEGVVKAAIVVFDADLDIEQDPELTTNNIVVVRIRTAAWSINVVSFYFEPTASLEPYVEHIMRIREKTGTEKLILAGDANAKSVW